MNEDRPTMGEYVAGARERLAEHIAAMSTPERINFATQMEQLRLAARLSGIPEWTDAHTVGALWATSALGAMAEQLHHLGVIDHDARDFWRTAVLTQERYVLALERESS